MYYDEDSILDILRTKYTPGTRIELDKMDDPQAPPVGTQGTVIGVDRRGSIMVEWDNGSSLNVVFGKDKCHIIKREQPRYEFNNT